MSWQRARRPEQKAERRAVILNAAETLLRESGLDSVSLNGIAREAGVSKANIYRYFESREAIYISLAEAHFEVWVGKVEPALAPLAGSDDEAAVAETVVATLAAMPDLVHLMSKMPTVLERNVTTDEVIRFKTAMMSIMLRLGNAFQVAMPSLTPDKARRALFLLNLLVVGIWPVSHPPQAVVEAYERVPELAVMRVDFRRELTTATELLLRGLKSQP